MFVHSHDDGVPLRSEIEIPVLVPNLGDTPESRHGARQHVAVLHGREGDVEAHHLGDVLRPGSASVHHDAGLDGAGLSLYADDFFLVVRGGFGEDINCWCVFVELGSSHYK